MGSNSGEQILQPLYFDLGQIGLNILEVSGLLSG
jgi:hypothetical protein